MKKGTKLDIVSMALFLIAVLSLLRFAFWYDTQFLGDRAITILVFCSAVILLFIWSIISLFIKVTPVGVIMLLIGIAGLWYVFWAYLILSAFAR